MSKTKSDYSNLASKINTLYAKDLLKVEAALKTDISSDVSKVPEISEYLIDSGGKRLRPLLLIVASKLAGYEGGDDHISLGVVVEYIHAASLLHDDVVDGADTRRQIESTNRKFGNEASVLVGDYLFARAFELMIKLDDLSIAKALSTATKVLTEGELLQLSNIHNLATSEDQIIETIYRKTGALMEAAVEVGYRLGDNIDPDGIVNLRTYAKNIGIAFQLIDDTLDFTATTKKWGKPIGADLIEGKITIPILKGYVAASTQDKKFLHDAINSTVVNEETILQVKEILEKYGAFESTIALAKDYVREAKMALELFGDSIHKENLKMIGDYLVHRAI
ncbi:MAG: polyprenyl synthetase family protein [Nitrospinota bacterium]